MAAAARCARDRGGGRLLGQVALGAEVSVLLVGHSRGGAIANLVAAELDDLRAQAGDVASFGPVYVYVRCPATTLASDARSERYGNIFNIANPSDIMPTCRYRPGIRALRRRSRALSAGCADFDRLEDEMRAVYRESVGVECSPMPPTCHCPHGLRQHCRGGSAEELVTPVGALTTSDCWQRTSIPCGSSTAIIPARTSRGCPSPTSLNWGQVQIETFRGCGRAKSPGYQPLSNVSICTCPQLRHQGRMRMATVSTCSVWGNRSTGVRRSRR
ncbi:MAG: lipase family protein [Eggerthellaceae bacterium]